MGEISFGTREPKVYCRRRLDDRRRHGRAPVWYLPPGNPNRRHSVAAARKMTLTPTVSGDDMTVQYPILQALPAPTPLDRVTIPLLLHREISTRAGGQTVYVDPAVELAYLRGLRDDGGLIDFQDGAMSTSSAQVIGVTFQPLERDRDGAHWQGTAVVTLKVL